MGGPRDLQSGHEKTLKMDKFYITSYSAYLKRKRFIIISFIVSKICSSYLFPHLYLKINSFKILKLFLCFPESKNH